MAVFPKSVTIAQTMRSATTTRPVPWPEQWFTDYATSGAYGMRSLTDYLHDRELEELTGVTINRHRISEVTA